MTKEGKVKVALPTLFGTEAPRYITDIVNHSCIEAAKTYNAVVKLQSKLATLELQKETQRFPRSLQLQQSLQVSKATTEAFTEEVSKSQEEFNANLLKYKLDQLNIFIKIKRLDLQRANNEHHNIIPQLMAQLLEVFKPLIQELRGHEDTDNCSYEEFTDYIKNNWQNKGKRSSVVLNMPIELSNLSTWLFQIPTIIQDFSQQHHLEQLLHTGFKSFSNKEKREQLNNAEAIELDIPTSQKVAQLVDMHISKRLAKISQQIKKINQKTSPKQKNMKNQKNVRGKSAKSSGNAANTSNKRHTSKNARKPRGKGNPTGNGKKNFGKKHVKNSAKSNTKNATKSGKKPNSKPPARTTQKSSQKNRKRQKNSSSNQDNLPTPPQ